jgi:alkylated DNA nucleotide flippase Atl1
VQRGVLEDEGVVFAQNGRVDLERQRWQPKARSARALRR